MSENNRGARISKKISLKFVIKQPSKINQLIIIEVRNIVWYRRNLGGRKNPKGQHYENNKMKKSIKNNNIF